MTSLFLTALNANPVGNPILVPRIMTDFNDIESGHVVASLERCGDVYEGQSVITHDDGEHECDGMVVDVGRAFKGLVRIRLDWETWR